MYFSMNLWLLLKWFPSHHAFIYGRILFFVVNDIMLSLIFNNFWFFPHILLLSNELDTVEAHSKIVNET